MFLVKFRATEKDQWSPVGASSYLIEEYVDTEDSSYARMRAHQEMEKELKEKVSKLKIELVNVEEIRVIR